MPIEKTNPYHKVQKKYEIVINALSMMNDLFTTSLLDFENNRTIQFGDPFEYIEGSNRYLLREKLQNPNIWRLQDTLIKELLPIVEGSEENLRQTPDETNTIKLNNNQSVKVALLQLASPGKYVAHSDIEREILSKLFSVDDQVLEDEVKRLTTEAEEEYAKAWETADAWAAAKPEQGEDEEMEVREGGYYQRDENFKTLIEILTKAIISKPVATGGAEETAGGTNNPEEAEKTEHDWLQEYCLVRHMHSYYEKNSTNSSQLDRIFKDPDGKYFKSLIEVVDCLSSRAQKKCMPSTSASYKTLLKLNKIIKKAPDYAALTTYLNLDEVIGGIKGWSFSSSIMAGSMFSLGRRDSVVGKNAKADGVASNNK